MGKAEDRVLFPEEKQAEMVALFSDGREAEQILRSPLWARLFASMRETAVEGVLASSSEQSDLLAAKARLQAITDLQRVLLAVFTKAKHTSQQPQEAPVRDVKPRKRTQP